MSLKHAFLTGLPAGTDPTKVDGPKWDAGHLVDADGIPMASSSAGAVAPASGLKAFAQDYAGRPMLSVIAPTGGANLLQAAFLRARPAYWLPHGSATNVTASGIGFNAGSPTARNVGTTSYFASQKRIGYQTPATVNANVNARAGAATDRAFFLGSVPRTGGFFNVWRIGTSLYANDARCFFGLLSSSSAYGSASPSSLTDMIGIGFDAGDTTWSIYCNDGGGVPTKVALSASFPCNTNNIDVIEFAMRVAPGSQTVYWQVTNMTTGVVATGTMANDLPIEIPMQPHVNVTNGPSAAAAAVDLMLMYVEVEN